MIADQIEAFATRLEQDEGPRSLDPDAYRRATIEQGREEGRREILAEIQRLHPTGYGGLSCLFCDVLTVESDGRITHKPECLWLQAQQLVAPKAG